MKRFLISFFSLLLFVCAAQRQLILYGVASGGGAGKGGVIYSYKPATGTFTKLKDFVKATGSNPQGGLVEAANGKLYGVTVEGGKNGGGVIYSFDPVTAAYAAAFHFNRQSGYFPSGCTMYEAANGKLYGTTYLGGKTNGGVLFSVDPATAVFKNFA